MQSEIKGRRICATFTASELETLLALAWRGAGELARDPATSDRTKALASGLLADLAAAQAKVVQHHAQRRAVAELWKRVYGTNDGEGTGDADLLAHDAQ